MGVEEDSLTSSKSYIRTSFLVCKVVKLNSPSSAWANLNLFTLLCLHVLGVALERPQGDLASLPDVLGGMGKAED